MILAATCIEVEILFIPEEILEPPVTFDETSGPPKTFTIPPTFKSGIADAAEADIFKADAAVSIITAASCKSRAFCSLSDIFLMFL